MKNSNTLFGYRPIRSIKTFMKILTISLILLFSFMPQNFIMACMGTPAPPCGRSVSLAKFTPGVVVFPPAGGAISVPIGVLPFAWWNPNPVCAQPTSASLMLTLTCFPSGVVIGPQNFTVATPTFPGPQPVGGPVTFVIPAGTFPAGSPPQICLVSGVYTVTFSDNVMLSFTGDTEVCIVPPSPLDASEPRLDMQYIKLDDDGYRTCRRGDQANFYFLIANNDPDEAVNLDLSSIGRQTAQLPDGYTAETAYDDDVYSISMPVPGTDAFAAAFGDELMPGELLPDPDPSIPNDQLLERGFSLQPCEATIICITMRSNGMCGNGSCNERLVKVEGSFVGGDPALACASTLYVVDDAPAKTVLCEVLDSVKVNEISEAVWSPTQYGDIFGPFPHAKTFAVGNLPPGADPGYQTTGDNIPSPFFQAGSEYIRLTDSPQQINYSVNYFSAQCDVGVNDVTLVGLDNFNQDFFAVPVISFQFSTEPLELIFDLPLDQLSIFLASEIIYDGPIDSFFVNPLPEFCIDPEVCRIFQKRSDLSDKSIFVEPPVVSRLFDVPNSDPGCDTLTVFDNLGDLAVWDATISGDGLILPSTSGMGDLEFCYDGINALPVVPATTISFIDVECPDALGVPLRVPVAIRIKDTTTNIIHPEILAQKFILHPAAPNPFSESTIISGTLTEATMLSLKIFNINGQEVAELLESQKMEAGQFSFEWDGTNHAKRALSEGIYICQMKAGEVVKTMNMVLVK